MARNKIALPLLHIVDYVNNVIILIPIAPSAKEGLVFKRLFETSSGQGPVRASSEERPAMGLPASPTSDWAGNEPPPNNVTTKMSTFDELYRKSTLKSTAAVAEWNILK